MPELLARTFSSSREDVELRAALAALRPPVLTVEALLEREVDQIVEESRLTRDQVLAARRKAAQYVLNGECDVGLEEDEEWGVSSGNQEVDSLLGPFGFPAGNVCEVVGPSGSGKTQLCLTVAANAVARGRNVHWIQAGSCSFYEQRFLKILGERTRMGQMTSEFVEDAQSLVRGLENCPTASVVIVDSPCAVLSPNLGGDRNHLGYRDISLVAFALAKRSKQGAVVLVVNGTVRASEDDSPKETWKPALGIAWTYAVGILLSLCPRVDEDNDMETGKEDDFIRSRRGVALLKKHPHGEEYKTHIPVFTITEDDGFTTAKN